MSKKEVAAQSDATAPAEPKPMTEPEGGWPADEFTGLPGRYERDPATGVRRPAGNVTE